MRTARIIYPYGIASAILGITLMLTPLPALAQNDVYTRKGAFGQYVYCGKDIPKGFRYIIERSTRKADWTAIGQTAFVNDSTHFYHKLATATSLNIAYLMPDANSRAAIWNYIQRASIVDSIPYHSAYPSFLQALGTVFYDTTASPGQVYHYRISRSDRSGSIEVVSSTNAAIATSKAHTVYAEPFETHVNLRYYSFDKVLPATMRLYRETYLQSGFQELQAVSAKVADDGRVFFHVTDSLVRPGIVYRYFAVPYDVWGNAGLPSDTVRLSNDLGNDSPLLRKFTAVGDTGQRAIRLQWEVTNPARLEGAAIYRSPFYEAQEYVYIGSANAKETVFYDRGIMPGHAYYYSIVLRHAKGRTNPSIRANGLLPASKSDISLAPSELNVSDMGNGKLQLRWTRPGNDVKGYYLYRDIRDGRGFVQRSELIQIHTHTVEYMDSLSSSHDGQIAYTVRTLNLSDNLSHPSEAVSVYAIYNNTKAVLLHPPSVVWNGKTAMLHWQASSADNNSPYVSFQIQRQESDGGKQFDEYKTLSPELPAYQNYWEDSTYTVGKTYNYRILAHNPNGEWSEGASTRHYIAKSKILSPAGLRIRNDGNKVHLLWDSFVQEGVAKYRILRHNGVDTNDPVVLAEIDSSRHSYTDTPPTGQDIYYYTVVSINKEDVASEVNNWIGVRLD